jgi:ATP-dependent protease ClpP protease subunit
MELIDITPAIPNNRVWDWEVPIITNKHITDVYITDSIDNPSLYNELCHRLRTADPIDQFNIHLNTPGGIIDSAFMIIDAIKNSRANIVACLSGTIASAGTLIALSCNELQVADYTAWMSHNYSGGAYGKGHEMKARQEFVDSQINKTFHELHAGFFTEKEIEAIIEGKDFWMGKDEILKRWEAKQKLLSAAKEATNA